MNGLIERSLSVCTDDIASLQREMAHLKAQSEQLENKCKDLEARSRRNNIKIAGVPESQASSTVANSELLQIVFNLSEAPLLDRSHRSLAPASRQGEQPRAVVARLHYFRDCANILCQAREKQRIRLNGMTISVFPDFTARVPRARAGYNGVRQQLRGLEGVQYGILYLARFWITHNNQDQIFSTPEDAQSYIKANIPSIRSPSGAH